MAKFTKAAIAQSFMKLLNKQTFDKITVKDIVDDCGINRNTFYYNYSDIYALVDDILQNEVNSIVEKQGDYHSWNEGLMCAADFAIQNKRAVYHLYNSVKRQQIERYFDRVIYDVVLNFVLKRSQGHSISRADIQFVARFYSCALLGLIEKWLDAGMKDDFYEIINKTGVLFDSNINRAIEVFDNK